MAERITESEAGFKRCALCKIDLKGRFVYIDDFVEQLLDCGREELFGKSLLDFLDTASQELLQTLLGQRSHYETHYDTARLTLVSSGGIATLVTAVISLSFAAGNPVNFQIILTPTVDVPHQDSPSHGDDLLPDAVETLLSSGGPPELKSLLDRLLALTGALQAAAYLIAGEKLEPRSAVCQSDGIRFAFDSVPEPTALHSRIAATETEYTFTDDDNVREAAEQEGTAPCEYVTTLSYGPDRQYLIRIIFAESVVAAQSGRAIDLARLVMRFAERLAAAACTNEQDTSEAVKFAVGLLDSLEIGAAVVDAAGRVAGFNPTMRRLLDGYETPDTYHDIARILMQANGEDVGWNIERYMDTPLDQDEPIDFKRQLVWPSGAAVNLVIIRFSFDPGDCSSCFVLVPIHSDAVANGEREQVADSAASAPARRGRRKRSDDLKTCQTTSR